MMEQRKRRWSTGSRMDVCMCRPKRASDAPRLSSKFSQADWATASIEAICADPQLREAFQAFLDERMTGEVLRLEGELEAYERADPHARSALAADIFHTYIDPSNEESPDTVTLGGDLVALVRKRIESKHFEANLFAEIMSEVRVMLTTNGLHDFLRQFQAPTLAECFADPLEYERFLSFARRANADDAVECVHDMLRFELDCRDNLGTPESRRARAVEVLRVAHRLCGQETGAAAEARIAAGPVDHNTFLECKNEVVGRLASDVFPAYVRSLQLE